MVNMITKGRKKRISINEDLYSCNICLFNTNNKTDYERHNLTRKHNDNIMIKNISKKTHKCICGKTYKYMSGLSRHKLKCDYDNIQEEADTQINPGIETVKPIFEHVIIAKQLEQMDEMKTMFYDLIQSNKELQNKLITLAREPKTITHNYKTNNQLNIMNYLNTECKDALNLTEFIQQLNYTFNDLLKLPNDGWVTNAQETFVQQLIDLDQHKRPIHCSDKKRKKFYVKDQDVWEKDDNNKKVLNAINDFQNKQCNTYMKWKQINKQYIKKSDKLHEQSMYLNIEVCRPSCDNGEKLKNKVLTSLTELVISKSNDIQ
jgi:hypothetical protein